MTILIIGAPEEAHSTFIYQKILKKNGHPIYLDTRRFPSLLKITLTAGPGTQGIGTIQETNDSQPVPLEAIEAVYWRYHMGFQVPPLPDTFLHDMAYREIESTVGSLFRMMPCRWVNSPAAINMHVYKTYQLMLLQQKGIRIPQTLVTNDADAVLEFYERLQGRVIYKPVRGGAHTAALKPEDLKPERLADLAKAPVQFQEMIEGVDVRAYLVKNEVFAGEIRSKTLDFRDDPNAPIVPVELPDSVVQDCLTLAETLELKYSGIDIRRTPEGEYVFLEGNPCPMFMHFEQQSGYPISDRLVSLIMHG